MLNSVLGFITNTRKHYQGYMKEEGNLYSIADEAATANESGLLEEDEDEGEDIIKSINSLLDKGKLRSDIEQTHPFSTYHDHP